MFDVVALGELLIDFAPQSVSDTGYPVLAANPGGAPGNFLAALSKYGCKTAMIGKVGDDAFGKLLIGTLKEAGIETRGIHADPDVFTTLAFVSLDASGNRDFSFARKPGADTCLTPGEVDESLLAGAKVFHFGTLSLTDDPAASATRHAIELAKKNGLLVSLDPNLRKPLWKREEDAKAAIEWSLRQTDIVKISDEEIAWLWGLSPAEGARKLLEEYGVSLVYASAKSLRDSCGGHHRRRRYLRRQRHEPADPVRESSRLPVRRGSAQNRTFRLYRCKPVHAEARRHHQRAG